jgi:hypothetical protein
MLDAQNPKRTPICASNGGSVAVYTPKRGFGVRTSAGFASVGPLSYVPPISEFTS